MARPATRPMTGRARIGFVGNSLANLLVGASALGYAVVVPAVVVRRFGTDRYGTWYLAFQIAAYVLLLDLGSQYVVTKEAAVPAPSTGPARLATAAMVVQSGLAVAVVAVATAWAALTGQATLAWLVVILGTAATASLLASTVRAWFGGLERSHVPAGWLVGGRVAALAGLVVALAGGGGLVAVTVAVAAPQLVVYAGLLVWARRPPSPWSRPDRAAYVALVTSTLPLALWTVCGVLIAGVDIFIVRAVDAAEVGPYAVALPLLAIPIGVVAATTAAWTPRVAHAEEGRAEGGRHATLTATTLMAAALGIGAIFFVGLARDIVGLWAGPGDWSSATTYLRVLYLASCLRFVFLPWSILVVVRGEQARITAAPLAEAAVNLAASTVLGVVFGAIGVAVGTLVGAAVAAVLYVAWAVPRTAQSGVTAAGLVRAFTAAWVPWAATAALVMASLGGAGPFWRAVTAVVAVVVDGWWFLGRRGAPTVRFAGAEPS